MLPLDPDALFARHMGWAASIARATHRWVPPSFELDDLVQAAHMALWRCVRNFEPERGRCFRTYAYPWVQGACRMLVRRRNYTEATNSELPADVEQQDAPSAEQQVVERQQLDFVKAHVSILPRRARRLVVSVYLRGVPMTVQARRQRVSLSHAYTLRDAALERLRCQIDYADAVARRRRAQARAEVVSAATG